jgi:hypothetical protein
LREFAAVTVEHKWLNGTVCLILAALPPLVVWAAGGIA